MSKPQKTTKMLKIGPKPVQLEIISDPYVVFTKRGYSAAVRVVTGDGEFFLFIGIENAI